MAARKRTSAKRGRQSKGAKAKRRQRVDLLDAPKSTRLAVAREIRGVLRKHGIEGELSQLHVKPRKGARKRARKGPRAAARAALGAPAAVAPCPPGQVRRVVCFVRRGTFVCEQKCVPV
jgi:hypothetical protein